MRINSSLILLLSFVIGLAPGVRAENPKLDFDQGIDASQFLLKAREAANEELLDGREHNLEAEEKFRVPRKLIPGPISKYVVGIKSVEGLGPKYVTPCERVPPFEGKSQTKGQKCVRGTQESCELLDSDGVIPITGEGFSRNKRLFKGAYSVTPLHDVTCKTKMGHELVAQIEGAKGASKEISAQGKCASINNIYI